MRAARMCRASPTCTSSTQGELTPKHLRVTPGSERCQGGLNTLPHKGPAPSCIVAVTAIGICTLQAYETVAPTDASCLSGRPDGLGISYPR